MCAQLKVLTRRFWQDTKEHSVSSINSNSKSNQVRINNHNGQEEKYFSMSNTHKEPIKYREEWVFEQIQGLVQSRHKEMLESDMQKRKKAIANNSQTVISPSKPATVIRNNSVINNKQPNTISEDIVRERKQTSEVINNPLSKISPEYFPNRVFNDLRKTRCGAI